MAQAKKIINFLTLPLKITDNESNDMKPKRKLDKKKAWGSFWKGGFFLLQVGAEDLAPVSQHE